MKGQLRITINCKGTREAGTSSRKCGRQYCLHTRLLYNAAVTLFRTGPARLCLTTTVKCDCQLCSVAVRQVPKSLNLNAVAHAPRFSAGFPNSGSIHDREQRSQCLCIERLSLKSGNVSIHACCMPVCIARGCKCTRVFQGVTGDKK
jgi:hypothetical protein